MHKQFVTIKQLMLAPVRSFFTYIFNPIYELRIAQHMVRFCPPKAKILDFGCDDGEVGYQMMQMNPKLSIVGVDIQENNPSKIPKKIYDGKKLPYKSNSFDVVVSTDVLHHINDIPKMTKELARVSRNLVIIKDHRVYGKLSYYMICLSDYVSNAPFGIACAFNYLTMREWGSAFKYAGLKLVRKPGKISYGFGINEIYNPIFVLQKV